MNTNNGKRAGGARVQWLRSLLTIAFALVAAGFVAAAGAGESDHATAEQDGATYGDTAAHVSVNEINEIRSETDERLNVVATTNIVGDVVANILGDRADLNVLIPIGQNPHGYEPTPRAIAAIERGDIVFTNGFGLEENLLDIVAATATGYVVSVSEGIEPRDGDHDHDDHDEEHADHDHEADDHDHDGVDPHVWFDPNNVISWVDTIETALTAADPANAETYRENAAAYRSRLSELDREIRQRVAAIPEAERKLVVDHAALDHFADEYGFRVVGAVIPATTDQAEPSASAIAQLVEVIRDENAPAIFVGLTASDGLRDLVDTVADEVGRDIAVRTLLTGSLAPSGEEGDTYIDYIAYNTNQIMEGLGY